MSYLLIFLVFLLAVFAPYLRSPRFKGKIGEAAVRLLLHFGLDKNKYHVLHDVTLPIEEGTSQIDHVVLSRFGIFVIETKNYSGWIFGSEHDAQWTWIKYGSKHSFQNPLRQNRAHIHALRELTGLDESVFKNIVVFTGNSRFKTSLPPNVCHLNGLLQYLRCFQRRLLSGDQVRRALSQISGARLAVGPETDRAHVEGLKKRFGESVTQDSLVPSGRLLVVALRAIMLVALLFVGFQLPQIIMKNVLSSFPASKARQSAPTVSIQSPVSARKMRVTSNRAGSGITHDSRASSSTRLRQTRAYEKSLYCAYSVDTRRCACYDRKGIKADIEFRRCLYLSDGHERPK